MMMRPRYADFRGSAERRGSGRGEWWQPQAARRERRGAGSGGTTGGRTVTAIGTSWSEESELKKSTKESFNLSHNFPSFFHVLSRKGKGAFVVVRQ